MQEFSGCRAPPWNAGQMAARCLECWAGSLRSFSEIRKEAGPFCGSFLPKGELFAYVGRIQNLKDLHNEQMAARCAVLDRLGSHPHLIRAVAFSADFHGDQVAFMY